MRIFTCECGGLELRTRELAPNPCAFCHNCKTGLGTTSGLRQQTEVPHSVEVTRHEVGETHQCRWCYRTVEEIKHLSELFEYQVRG